MLKSADVVYYLVHSLGEADFEEEDLKAAETTAQAAERSGVKQLVYLGGLGDDSPDSRPTCAAVVRPLAAWLRPPSR